MIMPVIVICVGAGLSYIVSRQIYDAYHGELTTLAFVGYLAFLSFLFPLVLILAVSLGARGLSFVVLNFLIWLPTVVVFRDIVGEYFTHLTIGNLFFSSVNKPVRNHLGKVRMSLWEEAPQSALKACLEEFDQYPDDADILLDGAALFEEHGHYEQALYLYQKAINFFSQNPDIWPIATYHAAVLYLEHFNSRGKACELFGKLAEEFPDREIGMRARERMREEPPPVAPPGTAPPRQKRALAKTEATDIDQEARGITRTLEDEMPGLFIDDESLS